jgi:hypothetical protein
MLGINISLINARLLKRANVSFSCKASACLARLENLCERKCTQKYSSPV